eukprot:jgi/Chlat1/2121/Chrsp17S02841
MADGGDGGLVDLFEAVARLRWRHRAVVQVDTESEAAAQGDDWSYADLHSWVQALVAPVIAHVEQWRQRRKDKKVDPDDVDVPIVGVHLPPSPVYLAAVLAVLAAGAAFMPLDMLLPAGRLRTIVTHAQPCLLLSKTTLSMHWLAGEAIPVLLVESVVVDSIPANPPTRRLVQADSVAAERKFCYVLYTSGSTGIPKGVCGTEIGLVERCLWMHKTFPYQSGDVCCFKTAIGFVDHLAEAFAPLLAGVPVVAISAPLTGPHTADLLHEWQVTHLTTVPSLLRVLLPYLTAAPKLRFIASSGEPLTWGLAQAVQDVLPGATLVNIYGSTEVAGDCSYFEVCPSNQGGSDNEYVPIGRPLANFRLHVLDERQQPPHTGTAGTLYVEGPGVGAGYLRLPEETPAKFVVADKCHHHQRLYATGDIVRWTDAGLCFIGREDLQVKVRGVRVDLSEIEIILGRHPGVAEVAVRHWTNGIDARIAAYVVPRGNDAAVNVRLPRALVKSAEDNLPAAAVPAAVVLLSELPRTPAGKLDRIALPEVRWAEHIAFADSFNGAAASANEAVNKVIQVFSRVLACNMHPDSDFFAAGGSSITAALAAHELHIDLHALYERPTARLLAAARENRYRPTRVPQAIELKQPQAKRQKTAKHPRLPAPLTNAEATQVDTRGMQWQYAFTRSNGVRMLKPEASLAPMDPIGTETPHCFEPQWAIDLQQCVDASPLILATGNESWRVFIGSHAHKFACIDGATGREVWVTDIGGRVESSATVTADGLQVVFGCYDFRVYFLSVDTGAILGRFITQGEVKCSPAISWNGIAWCGSHDHCIYAIHPETYQCIWQHRYGGSVLASPVFDERRRQVYITAQDGCIQALEENIDGVRILWTSRADAPIFSTPAIDSKTGTLFVACVNAQVLALSQAGEVLWKMEVGGPVFGGLTKHFEVLLAPCADGKLYVLCMRTGRQLWRHTFTASVVMSPCVVHISDEQHATTELALVASSDGLLSLLDVSKCMGTLSQKESLQTVMAQWKLPGPVFSSPVLFRNFAVVGCRDNYVHCLRLN